VLQSEIIKLRGAGAYDHIKELLVRELINKREEGRSSLLTTTKKFQEYFRLSKDGKSFRQQLSKSEKPVDEGANQEPGDEVALEIADSAVQSPGEDELSNLDPAAEVSELEPVELEPLAEAGDVFDASPDPGTPPIGIPGSDEDEVEIEVGDTVTTGDAATTYDLDIGSSVNTVGETTTS